MTNPNLDALAIHQGRIRALARALLRDDHAAEDVVQEAWVRALQSGPRDPGAIRAWFETIVRNLALDRRRSTDRRNDREREVARDERVPSSAEIAAEFEVRQRLVQAVDDLREPFRTALRDRYLGELSIRDIATRDGVSENAVRARLGRARQALREHLDSIEQPSGGTWMAIALPAAGLSRDALSVATVSSTLAGTTSSLGALTTLFAMKQLVVLTCLIVLAAVTWRVWPESAPLPDPGPAPTRTEVSGPEIETPGLSPRLASGPGAEAARSAAAPDASAPLDGEREGTWPIRGRAYVVDGIESPPKQTLEVTLTMTKGRVKGGAEIMQQVVSTDAQGRFHSEEALPDETVMITARARVSGYLVQSSGAAVFAPGTKTEPLLLVMRPVDAELFGTVRTDEGEPVPDANVQMPQFTATSDENGEYRMAVVAQFARQVTATADGMGMDRQTIERISPGGEARHDFVLGPELRITGYVRDAAERPIAGAKVRTFYGNNLEVEADDDGRYTIEHLPRDVRDTLHVFARADQFCESSTHLQAPIEGHLEQDFTLERGARVRGRVLNAGGAAVTGVGLFLGHSMFAYDRIDAASDSNGQFEFPIVPEGAHLLWVVEEGFAPYRSEIAVPKGARSIPDLTVTLARGRTVQGTVRGPDGAPLEGVQITTEFAETYFGARPQSGADGTFQLVDLPDAPVEVHFHGAGMVRTTLNLAADASGPLDVAMQPAGGLAGRVVDDATSEPIASFTIRFLDPVMQDGDERLWGFNATWSRQGHSFESERGTWSTEDAALTPNTVIGLQAIADGYAPTVFDRAVVGLMGGDERIEIRMQRPTRLRVSVVGSADGAPIEGVYVGVRQNKHPGEHDLVWSGQTDASGVAIVEDAAPGRVYVTGRTPGSFERVFGPFEPTIVKGEGSIEVRMGSRCVLRGVARDDATGAPAAGLAIRLQPMDVKGIRVALLDRTTGADGRFEFEDIPAGNYRILRRRPDATRDHFDLAVPVTVAPEASPVTQDVVAPEGDATIEAKLRMTSSTAATVVAELTATDGSGITLRAYASDNRVVFENLTPGSYTLHVAHSAADWTPIQGSMDVTVQPGETQSVELPVQ